MSQEGRTAHVKRIVAGKRPEGDTVALREFDPSFDSSKVLWIPVGGAKTQNDCEKSSRVRSPQPLNQSQPHSFLL